MPQQINRYSDEELKDFEFVIKTKIAAAQKELDYLQGLIKKRDSNGDDIYTGGAYKQLGDNMRGDEMEHLAQMAARQIQLINHLNKALIRIEHKTYGICRVTGKLIDKGRLLAVPHATLSIEAKRMMK